MVLGTGRDVVTDLASLAPAGKRGYCYSADHPTSPLAQAWDVCGPVKVDDRLRADIAHCVDRHDMRRAYALGLISKQSGRPADVHQADSGLWADLTPADYLAEWITVGCAWHVSGGTSAPRCDEPSDEHNADRALLDDIDHAEQVQVWATDLVGLGEQLPAWWSEWAGRLLHPPKFAYLVELGAHTWLDAPAPAALADRWAVKMRRQWANRARTVKGRAS